MGSLPFVDKRCGTVSSQSRLKRIVAGNYARQGSWPWLVSLRTALGYHMCAGVLISPKWVVTAAHCFRFFLYPRFWRVRVGEHNLATRDGTEQDLRVLQIIKYPGYQDRWHATLNSKRNGQLSGRFSHDLALVKLREDAPVDQPFCNSICLTSQMMPSLVANVSDIDRDTVIFTNNNQCWVAGWGDTKENFTNTSLKEVQGYVIGHEQCESIWQKGIGSDMVCFGNGTSGPCKGDSGGPLMCRKNGQFYLIGIVSWGTEQCIRTGYPSVFTRISNYIPWIRQTMSGVPSTQDDQPEQEPFE
ncbi:elastase-1-like [Liolophura sinensis]|uniref:elastase-1-like n=1 Tax=Liolophura sinensis TaxID=3198878 RepID=UPI003158D6FD